jgi:hypothetical protein
MALTIETILNAENDQALFDLLSAELQRLLPPEYALPLNQNQAGLDTGAELRSDGR